MSRVAKSPITVPSGVDVTINGQQVQVKGPKGTLSQTLNALVTLSLENGVLSVAPVDAANRLAWMQAGTARALLNNLVVGVSQGFERKLQLVGVGYKAQAQGKNLNLTLGFSHPIVFTLPEGVTAETPSQTDIVMKSADKQLLGAAAAKVRSYRPPEPYKGKGVRYVDEVIIRKEAKKK